MNFVELYFFGKMSYTWGIKSKPLMILTSSEQYDFTNREIEIIQLSKRNFSCKEIAVQLCISEHTVRKHRQNILIKIGGVGKKDFRIFTRKYLG